MKIEMNPITKYILYRLLLFQNKRLMHNAMHIVGKRFVNVTLKRIHSPGLIAKQGLFLEVNF